MTKEHPLTAEELEKVKIVLTGTSPGDELTTPSPPGEKATTSKDQARKASTGDGAGYTRLAMEKNIYIIRAPRAKDLVREQSIGSLWDGIGGAALIARTHGKSTWCVSYVSLGAKTIE
jgi:hypothetical protein